MPGAGFQAKARVWRQYAKDMADTPLKYVKEELVRKSRWSRCFDANVLERRRRVLTGHLLRLDTMMNSDHKGISMAPPNS